jgi:hypothetical protein
MIRRTGKANRYGMMGKSMMENGKMIGLKVKAIINGPITHAITEDGLKVKCQVLEHLNGLMVGNTVGNSKLIKNMDMVLSLQLMARNSRDNGVTTYKMVKAY